MENLKNRKILTIAIPTWNRAIYLNELLEQLCIQILKFNLEDKIEILVSNNNSDDNSRDIVDNYLKKYNFITYHENKENIGAKSNLILAMQLASAEFVMVLGDDDRIQNDCLVIIIDKIKLLDSASILIDISISKMKDKFSEGEILLNELVEYFYWYMGNAGLFIIRSELLKEIVFNINYELFNECWPQTQIMILIATYHFDHKCYIAKLNIHSNSLHGELMIYNSFYLWRTCQLELLNAINSIKNYISNETYLSARKYLKNNIIQQFYNILQCGIYVDDFKTRKKTIKSIINNYLLFSKLERVFLIIIIFSMMMPLFISKLLGDIFIFFLKGKKGLEKKNNFVNIELKKRMSGKLSNSGSIRALEFEIDK